MAEIINAANAKGLDIDPDLLERMLEYTRNMEEYRASALIDFKRGQPLEMESIFLEPLRQASAAGIDAPRLEALCGVLSILDRRSSLSPGR
jgi:2-dehydropantoate 2-reductase